MAITVKSVTTNAQGDQSGTTHLSTISLTTPSASVGDLLVIIASNDYYTLAEITLTSISPTATATEMTSFDSDGGSNQPHIKGWWAPVTTAGAVTVTVDTAHQDEEKALAVYILSGADTTSPVDASANTGALASASNLPAPSVSPATATSLLISHVQTNGSGAARTYTAPGSMSNTYNVTDGSFMRALGGSEQLSASGATGTRTWTGSGSAGYTAASVAIKAAATATNHTMSSSPAWVTRTVLSGSSIAPNGTTSHTCTFTAATSGNFLVAVLAASATISTPTGWTLVQNQVLDASLVVFTKTASAGESSFTVTHNASNYPMEGVIYEFPASSYLLGTSGGNNNVGGTGAGPTCSGMSGVVYTRFSARAQNMQTASGTSASVTWSLPSTKDYDVYTNGSSTDGIYLTIAYDDGCISGSFTPRASTAISGGVAAGTIQAVSFAVASTATAPTPRFEQGDYFGNSSSDITIQATFPYTVIAGNLLVAAVSFQSTAITATVTDTAGNTYHAIGPQVSSTLGFSDYIFYTVANANTSSNVVTVTLSNYVTYRRLLIHEYQGVDTFDASSGAVGSSGAPDSGSATTLFGPELIFGWGISNNGTTTAGSGFTLRETSIVESTEDKIATTAGTYNAVYPSDGSAWIAQMATFYYGTALASASTTAIFGWIRA